MVKFPGTRPSFRSLLEASPVIIVGFLPFLWFPSHWIVNGNDTSYPLHASAWAYGRLFAWSGVENGGTDQGSQVGGLLWHALQYVFQSIVHDSSLAEKLFFSFWFSLSGLAMWAAVRAYTRNPFCSYIATALYMLNPYLMTGAMWENASAANVSLYAVFPILFFVFILCAEKRLPPLYGAALFGLAASVASAFGMLPPLQIAFLIQGMIVIMFLFLTTERARWKAITVATLAVSACFLAVSAYWIIPLGEYVRSIAVQTGGSLSLSSLNHADWLTGISSHTSVEIVARLLGAWDFFASWHGEDYNPYSAAYLHNPLLLLLGFLLPALAYGSVFIVRRPRERSLAILCALSAIVFTLLSAGAHAPTGVVYVLLYKTVPGFGVIRSPWFMFEGFTVFNYAVLLGLGFAALTRVRSFRKWRVAGLIAAVCGICIYSFPLISGNFLKPFRQQTPGFVVRYPVYVEQTARFLEAQEGGRYLCLPLGSAGYIYRWNGEAFASGVPVLRYVANSQLAFTFPGEGASSPAPFDAILRHALVDVLAENPAAAGDLQLLGIDNVVVQSDQWFDFSGATISPEVWEEAVQRIPGAHRVASYGPWHVYALTPSSVITGRRKGVAGELSPATLGAWQYSTNGLLPELEFDPGTPAETIDSAGAQLQAVVSDSGFLSGRIAPYFVARHPGLSESYVLTDTPQLSHSRNHRLQILAPAASRRTKDVKVLDMDQWYSELRRIRTFEPPPAHAMIAGAVVQMPVRYVDTTHAELTLLNPGRSSSRAEVVFDGGGVRPENLRGNIVSWDGTVLELRVPPGEYVQKLRYDTPFKARMSHTETLHSVAFPALARPALRRQKNGILLSLSLSGESYRTEGLLLPIASLIPIDLSPTVGIRFAQLNTDALSLFLLADVESMNGHQSQEVIPLNDGTVNLLDALNAEYEARWRSAARRNSWNYAWSYEHRIPPHVQGSMIKRLSLLVEKTAGVQAHTGPATLLISDINVRLRTAHQPLQHSIDLDMSPSTAEWLGFKNGQTSSVHVRANGISLEADQQQIGSALSSRGISPSLGERYNVLPTSGQPYVAILQRQIGDWYNFSLADGTTRLINKSAVMALVPISSSGAVTIKKRISMQASHRTLHFTFALRRADQQTDFQLVLRTSDGRIVRSTFSDGNQLLDQGIRFDDARDLSTTDSPNPLVDELLGATAVHAVEGARLLTVDLDQLTQALGIDNRSTLVTFSIDVRPATPGFVIGRLTLTDNDNAEQNFPKRPTQPRSGLTSDTAPLGAYAVMNDQRGQDVAVNFKQINPTCWLVDATNAKGSFVLTFSQNYAPGWEAVEQPAWTGCSKYFAFGPNGGRILPHFRADGYKNAWLTTNARENRRIVLYYRPQRSLDGGLVLTLLALAFCGVVVLQNVTSKVGDKSAY